MRATPYSFEELEAIAIGRQDSDAFGNEGKELANSLAQEVLYLREWMAYTGRVIEAQSLDVKSLSKGRRKILREAVIRLRTLALGRVLGWPGERSRSREHADLRGVGEPYAKDYVGDLTEPEED